jgi:hypothetical protein
MAKRKSTNTKNPKSRSKKTAKRLAIKAARPVKKNRAGGKKKARI